MDYEGVVRLIAAVIDQAAWDLAQAIECGKPQYQAALFLETCASDGSGSAAVRRIRQSRKHRQRIIRAYRGLNCAKAQTIAAERRNARGLAV